MGTGDRTMELQIAFFVMALMLSDATSVKTRAYFNETADLPCQFPNNENISVGELVIFWQDQNNLVLYEFYLGKEKCVNVNAKYRDRTTFDQENWTLQLHNVQIKNQGPYQCFIHRKKPELVSFFHMTAELSVVANYSEPEIVPVSNITRNSDINLTCSSSQGYPKPVKMFFLLNIDNSTVSHDGVMQLFQDNVTELYTISTSLSFAVPDDVSNVTVICVLQTESMKTPLVSSPFYIVLKDPLPVKDQRVTIAFVLVLILFSACLLFCMTWMMMKKKKKKPRGTCGGDTIKMEKEETKEREKIYVPEQNDDEGQCAVHHSETPSGD